MNETGDSVMDDAATPGTWIGVVLGVWLSGVFAASLFGKLEGGRESLASLLLLGVSVVWPFAYFALGRARFVPASMPSLATAAVVLFGLVSAVSSLFSPIALVSTGYVVLTLASLWLALQFNTSLDASAYERGLKVFAGLTAALLAAFAWYDYVPGTRLGTGRNILNPNTIALVATSVVLAAMVIKTWVVRLIIMAPVAVIIVLTSSRAAAIAVTAGLAMIVWLRLRASGRTVLVSVLAVLLTLALAITFYGEEIFRSLDRVYALSTADRGIGSGASGRLAAWTGTWDLFVHNPAVGVGFRAHEHLLKTDTSAHNGYLATLAEIGLIGFAAVVYLVGRALRGWWRAAHDSESTPHASVLFGLCVGYLLLALFERYLINVGNPTSLLFLLCLMQPAAQEVEYRDDEIWASSDDEPLTDVLPGVSRA